VEMMAMAVADDDILGDDFYNQIMQANETTDSDSSDDALDPKKLATEIVTTWDMVQVNWSDWIDKHPKHTKMQRNVNNPYYLAEAVDI
jgi:hypothetical protein